MGLFQSARFVAGASELSQLPRTSAAEVAFAGRSNAGKSSAINALLNRKKLAFVSRTPGRTQQVNYFDLGDERYLVDLPGYGYAKVAKSEQAHWESLLPAYLRHREALRGLVLIMDIRHPLTALDALLLRTFAPTAKPVHVLLTKADKLSRGAAVATLGKVESALAGRFAFASCQLFSSVSKEGVEDARNTLGGWLRGHPATNREKKKPPVKGEQNRG
jgi:GTP-binding protein